jgi:phosphatidylinositol phospholipase C delta
MLRRLCTAKIMSGQSLPLPSDIEVNDCKLYVEATIFIPGMDAEKSVSSIGLAPPRPSAATATSDSCLVRTKVIAGNAYNPAWNESVRMSFDTYSGLLDLCFLKIEVKTAVTMGDDVSVAQYCASLRTLEQGEVDCSCIETHRDAHQPFLRSGYRYLPLFDSQMSQYLFSTLFVKINLTV